MKRILLAIFAAITICTAFTGCHTVRGAGEDIESAGEGIRDATR